MARESVKPYRGTQAVQRALALLQLFSDDKPEWRLNALTTALQLNRTTAYRLLRTLESEGMVVRDPESDLYRLGSELIILGMRAQRANQLRQLARPELEHVAAETGETTTLELMRDSQMIIVDEVLGERLSSVGPSVGTRWPVHATSTGLAMLAILPAWQEVIAGDLHARTAHTLTTLAELQLARQEIRETGYAVVSDALELGYTAVGAAIVNHEGDPVAAFSVGGASARFAPRRIRQVGAIVHDAARRVSYQLGYRDPRTTAASQT